MRGRSTVHIHPRPISGGKTSSRYRKSEDAESVTLIDLDTEQFDNVIVLDVPDSFPNKWKGSSMHRENEQHSLKNVICIDDDEIPSRLHSDIDAKIRASAAEASTRSHIPSTWDFEDIDAEVDEFGQKKATPVKLSKCKRTYSGKASTGNHYGLNTESESDSSASDYPDCELVEDVSGKVQEEWEKAFRRKKVRHSGQFGMRYQSLTFSVLRDNYRRTFKRTSDSQNTKPPIHPCTKKFSNEEADPSTITTKENVDYNSVYASVGGSKFRGKHTASAHQGHVDHQHFRSDRTNSHDDDKCKHSASSRSPCQTAFRDVEDGSLFASQHSIKKGYHRADSPTVDEIPLVSDLQFHKAKVQHDEGMPNSESGKEDGHWHSDNGNSKTIVANCMINEREMIKETHDNKRVKEDSINKGYHQADSQTVTEIPLFSDIQINEAKIQQDEDKSKCKSGEEDHWHSVNGKSRKIVENCMINEREIIKETDDRARALEDSIKKGYHQTEWRAVAEIPLFSDVQIHKAKIQQDEDMSNSRSEKEEDHWHSENGNSRTIVENCVINEREMIKETDDYKRAVEEEWASRQQVLQIQAEEAQHLRRLQKRRRAESTRLLDMEKRQKQRVEEIRNTQKKDEENMNLKEVIRTEVSQELQKLEVMCHSMGSLLHYLGVHVDGWPNPVHSEVQAAYKRALLTFHPDRALHYDLRRQVEAEEKFKLMNRFKEKIVHSELMLKRQTGVI